MKKQFIYIGSVIILIISIFTFVVFGFGTEVFTAIFGNSNKMPAFGKYDGQKIEYASGTKFAQVTQNLANNYKNQGYEINSQVEFYIFSEAFDETIMNLAFTKAVDKSGYKVPEAAVNREMLPYFYDANGKYSEKLYNQTDDSTINNMHDEFTESLKYSRYASDLLGGDSKVGKDTLYGIKSSSKETAFITDMGRNKRSFNLVSFSTADFPKTEAANFAKAKSELFIKYDISAITLDQEKDAKSLLNDLKKNKISFADALSSKSQKYYTNADGKLASPYHYQIANMLSSEDDVPTVTGLAKDALSDVIKTKRGYTIFRGDGASVASDFNDDATLDIVLSYMKSNESGYIETYYSNIAKEFISEATMSDFDEACKKFEKTKVAVPAFALNYGNSSFIGSISSDVKELSGASTNENLLKTAFSLKANEISAPVVLGSNVLVLQLTGSQEDEPASSDSLTSSIASTDSSSLRSTLLASDKVENNFSEVFFNYFMKNTSEK